MITKVIMPQMSLTMQTGIIIEWIKNVGDKVSAGDPICIVEGDKATVDIEAPVDGYLIKVFADLDEEFPVKEILALIGDSPNLASYDPVLLESSDNQIASEVQEKVLDQEKPSFNEVEHSNRMKASPIARRLAKENDVDLSQLTGTGPGGLIGKDDILAFLVQKLDSDSIGVQTHTVPLSEIEKIIAHRMAQSNQEIPHFHLTIDLDITETNALRQESNKDQGQQQHLTLTDLFVRAISKALRVHPKLNATFANGQIQFYDQVNIGLAVDTSKGLLVVVIKDADKKSVFELAAEQDQIVERAVAGNQTPEDLTGGTFTITNLGMFGIKSFNPIIVPGQSGILSIGAVQKPPSETGQKTEVLNITLACDHRIVNGVEGAKFMMTVSDFISDPILIFK